MGFWKYGSYSWYLFRFKINWTRNGHIHQPVNFFLEPLVLTLDYRDDPKIFGMPEDKAPEEKPADGDTPTPKPFDRKVFHI